MTQSINFTHRFLGQQQDEFFIADMKPSDLNKAITLMFNKANATIALMQSSFECENTADPIDSLAHFYGLESVKMELLDIINTVEAYAKNNQA